MNATRFLMQLLGSMLLTAAPLAAEEIDAESYRPSWQVGQKWVVETVCRQSAARRELPANADGQRFRWQFEVAALEKVEDRECYRLLVACLAGDNEGPAATLWVDRRTMTLRQVQIRLPTPDGWRTLTEMYRTAGGQPFPAFAPLTVPPLELPLFQAGTKGVESFSYEASINSPGAKALDEVDFAYSIQQHLAMPEEEKIKDLIPASYAKSLAKKPTVEVQLEGGRSKVRQLWQPGVPWPLYSDNGIAQARLIEVVAPMIEK